MKIYRKVATVVAHEKESHLWDLKKVGDGSRKKRVNIRKKGELISMKK